MQFKKTVLAVLAAAALGSGAANAAYNLSGLVSGPVANPGSFTATVNASAADAGVASMNFVLNGFKSLDGYNLYRDVLTLTINGTQTFSGSFNLGGGGTSDTMFGTGTALTLNHNGVAPGTAVGWQGGTTTITGLSFNLLSGLNTFQFAYSAPGILNGKGQSLSDEGWGIASASVSSVSAVPEPETYALMLAGLGLMGTVARRRKQKAE